MPYTRNVSSFGQAPRPLMLLLYVTAGVSIAAGLLDRLFIQYLGILGPHQLLGLSWGGISSFFLWQPLTYLFVHHGIGGLSLGFLIELFFHMYLLWALGSAVMLHVGARPFMILYLVSGLAAGLCGLAMMQFLGVYSLLLGASPAIYGMMAVWAMLFPELELELFFSIRVTGKWLFLGLLGVVTLIDVSQGDFVGAMTSIAGAIAGYLFGVIVWNLRSPVLFMHGFEAQIARLGDRVRNREQQTREMLHTVYNKAKVYDFETGEAVLDDEEFVDAMLTKISLYGEKSLTRKEKKRMKEISQRKAEQQQ